MSCVSISINRNNQGAWWDHLEVEKRIPLAIDVLMRPDGPDEVIVPIEEANKILAWASALPGWEDEISGFGNPLIFRDEIK